MTSATLKWGVSYISIVVDNKEENEIGGAEIAVQVHFDILNLNEVVEHLNEETKLAQLEENTVRVINSSVWVG